MGKKVEADFDGDLTTSDGDMMRLRKVESRLGIVDRIVGVLVTGVTKVTSPILRTCTESEGPNGPKWWVLVLCDAGEARKGPTCSAHLRENRVL